MKGDKTAFRIRIGNYRIGIYIIKDVIEFTRVLPRDKIYQYFPSSADYALSAKLNYKFDSASKIIHILFCLL